MESSRRTAALLLDNAGHFRHYAIPVGLLCEYFLCADNDAASEVAGWPLGPSLPPSKGRFRRTKPDPYPTVHAGSIDPVVLMGILEGLLTLRDVDAIIDRNATAQLGGANGPDVMVFEMSAELVTALRNLASDEVMNVAAQWATAEEFGGLASPRDLAQGVLQLSSLARSAQAAQARLYCWMAS